MRSINFLQCVVRPPNVLVLHELVRPGRFVNSIGFFVRSTRFLIAFFWRFVSSMFSLSRSPNPLIFRSVAKRFTKSHIFSCNDVARRDGLFQVLIAPSACKRLKFSRSRSKNALLVIPLDFKSKHELIELLYMVDLM